MASFGGSIYRESAVVKNTQPESLDTRVQLTTPQEWIVLVLMGLILITIVCWGVFGSVENTARMEGTLILAGERHIVRAHTSGVVTGVEKIPGEIVTTGQLLVQVAQPELAQLLDFYSLQQRAEDESRSIREQQEYFEQAPVVPNSELNGRDSFNQIQGMMGVSSTADGVITTTLVETGDTINIAQPIAHVVSGIFDAAHFIAVITTEDAEEYSVGTPAQISCKYVAEGEPLDAELVSVSTRAEPIPDWILAISPKFTGIEEGYVLRFSVSSLSETVSEQSFATLEGEQCRIEMKIGKRSPLSFLLQPRGSSSGQSS